MKRGMSIVLSLIFITCVIGCGRTNTGTTKEVVSEESNTTTVNRTDQDDEDQERTEENDMRLFVNEKEIPVIWEENASVRELMTEAGQNDIVVEMSMYSDNEQVGSLGRSYTRNDEQTTTHNGDIVLYSGSNIVVFYGSNSWAYTRLGKMELPEEEVTELLSNGDVTMTIKN